MKLAVVGGGSTYTPELVDGFSRLRDELPIDELWLIDPDPERRELIGGISRRMFARAGHPGKIFVTDDLRKGVEDADAVMFQLRVGGQQARHGDETFPHGLCGIGQETTGPGGFAKALRTVPVVLEAAEVVRKYAKPDAWIVDFTNPVGIVTRALLEAGHRAVGLCNVAIGFQRRYADRYDVAADKVRLDHVGLNHLTWERGVHVTKDGVETDVLPSLLRDHLEETAISVHADPRQLAMQQVVGDFDIAGVHHAIHADAKKLQMMHGVFHHLAAALKANLHPAAGIETVTRLLPGRGGIKLRMRTHDVVAFHEGFHGGFPVRRQDRGDPPFEFELVDIARVELFRRRLDAVV